MSEIIQIPYWWINLDQLTHAHECLDKSLICFFACTNEGEQVSVQFKGMRAQLIREALSDNATYVISENEAEAMARRNVLHTDSGDKPEPEAVSVEGGTNR